MIKEFISATPMSDLHIDLDEGYDIRLTSYAANENGYAQCIIIDRFDNNRYLSEGYLELNGHIFITKWKPVFDYYRGNYQYTKDLIVHVVE